MNEHDTGRLRAYLDGELSPDERRTVAAHLDRCARCSEALELLANRAEAARAGLGALETGAPDPNLALARFNTLQASAGNAGFTAAKLYRSLAEMKNNALSPRWRPAMIGATALLVVAILFTIAPVREAAADFLGLFRIRKFAVIPLDQQQLDRLAQVAEQAEKQFGDPQIVREKGPEQPVGDPAQASGLAGYTVRTPSRLPAMSALTSTTVQRGPAMHMEVDRAAVEAFMQAAGASAQGLPQTDKIAADVDVANIVNQHYTIGSGQLEFVQVPNPDVKLPEGLDPTALAETGFLFLGMPQEDARRLATSIDWTSTLVVPLPANAASAREVTIDGVTGLLLESSNGGRSREYALLWEKDDILYFMKSRNVDEKTVLDAADSLQ
jgi:hypothetical protein